MNIKRFYLIGFFLILALPLFTVSPWFFPAAWGKTIVFRIILSILIFLFLKQIIFKEIKLNLSLIFKNIAFLLLISLALFFILATIFSLNPYFSLWGSPHRGGGSLSFIFCIIFAILTFLILKPEDWKKTWNINFFIGILVCLTAVFQKFTLFKEILIPRPERAVSTMGSSVLLALYLLLLIFMVLSFAIKSTAKKRVFYLFCFALFIFTLFLTGSRAGFLGLIIGSFFFLFFYPIKTSKIKKIKIAFSLFLLFAIIGMFWLKTQPQIIDYLQKNEFTAVYFNRTWNTLYPIITEARFNVLPDRISTWKIGLKAIKDHPVFGYGPENFSIPFDKYFSPSLPGMNAFYLQWWDRAHNFVFDTGSTAGLPALIIYLSLFGFVFWHLQKIKKNQPFLAHGIQASFIAYFTANFFNFDCFSTHLLSFFLIGFSLSLIYRKESLETEFLKENSASKQKELNPFKYIITIIILLFFLFFIWYGNLKPLSINKEINLATYLAKKNNCQEAIQKMEKLMLSHSVIDNYSRLNYIEILNRCTKQNPEIRLASTQKGIQVLKESIKLRPYYTRSWWILNIYTNYLIGKGIGSEELKQEAVFYCEKAHQLSPNRWMILRDCANTYLLIGQYEKGLEKAQECIDLVPETDRNRDCWWEKGLANIAMGNIEEGEKDIKTAEKKAYNIKKGPSLYQLINAYKISLSKIEDDNKKNKIKKIINELSQELLKLRPELENEINEFLKTLE